MKKFVITLYLNKNGKLALNSDTKVLYLEAEDPNVFTDSYLEQYFPMMLVDYKEVAYSFENLDEGTELFMCEEGEPTVLVTIVHIYGDSSKHYIHVRDERTQYMTDFTFHANGIEATRAHKKAWLRIATKEEIEEYKHREAMKPFADVIEMLQEGHEGITLNRDKLELPSWMTIEKVNALRDFLNSLRYGEEY